MRLRFWQSGSSTLAPTVRELKDKAARLAGLRLYREAAEVYSQLAHLEEAEPHHRVRLGDMLTRLGHLDDAVTVYSHSLEMLIRANEVEKAMAVCGLILKLRPEDPQTTAILVSLQAQRRTGAVQLHSPEVSHHDGYC